MRARKIKRYILPALALCLLCSAAIAEDVRAEYQPVHVSLWTDTAAGYEWICEYDDNGVLSAPLEEIIESGGEGSHHNFYFGVNQPGTAEILFNYSVNYDVAVPEKSIICTVNVDESGKNSARWAECYSDDHMLVIMLPSNPTTGWDWAYQEDATGMITLVDEEYVPTDDRLEGAGGTTTFQFKVEQPGTAVLMFNYSNLWEPDAAAEETYSVIVTANEEMEISMAVDQQ